MTLTAIELTVLGLVAEQPRHGYNLEQVIEQRGIRRWADIGFSSIYYVLAKLEKRGLISADNARATTRSRRVFQATQEGCDLAASATLDFIATAQSVPHPFLVGLANKTLVTKQAYNRAILDRLAQIEGRIVAVAEAEHGQAPLPLPAREVFSYSLALLKAERTWLAERAPVSDD
ncbi:PadR family transcriptional regulator [Cryobacterium sp. N19]|uniref:PadR family transcriptional regulator n=1 Tax=Cryobacterium sp. N19 TaxID=2048288 RepID=UPI000CE47F0E|nr:PadR family transcriptional regulator [Cryobacterium sp. N19]